MHKKRADETERQVQAAALEKGDSRVARNSFYGACEDV
ncbi:hypothetical protein AusDCA_2715 [Desulfitobacterium sp. AusDCA]